MQRNIRPRRTASGRRRLASVACCGWSVCTPEEQNRAQLWWPLLNLFLRDRLPERIAVCLEWRLSNLEGITQKQYVDAVGAVNMGIESPPVFLFAEVEEGERAPMQHRHKDHAKMSVGMRLALENTLRKLRGLRMKEKRKLSVFGLLLNATQVQFLQTTVQFQNDDPARPLFVTHTCADWCLSLREDAAHVTEALTSGRGVAVFDTTGQWHRRRACRCCC